MTDPWTIVATVATVTAAVVTVFAAVVTVVATIIAAVAAVATFVAACAQILAAIFAAVTVWQAKEMMDQAEYQKQQSVAPSWDIEHETNANMNTERGGYVVTLPFTNNGNGPARKLAVKFESSNGNEPISTKGLGSPATSGPVNQNRNHAVELVWAHGTFLEGAIVISSYSALNKNFFHKFSIRTAAVSGNPDALHCYVAELS